jgi:hypothetical protein
MIPGGCTICPECGEELEKKRNQLPQLDGNLDELPEWMPPLQTGIRRHILEVIARKLDVNPHELAEDLIPQVPTNCFMQDTSQRFRESAVINLEIFIKDQNAINWDRFVYPLSLLLKRITGALCAAAESFSDFQAIAELNGYKPGWAYHRHQQKISHVRS